MAKKSVRKKRSRSALFLGILFLGIPLLISSGAKSHSTSWHHRTHRGESHLSHLGHHFHTFTHAIGTGVHWTIGLAIIATPIVLALNLCFHWFTIGS